MKIDKCQTPGAVFHISIHKRRVGCDVTLPIRLELSEDEAMKLEDKIHDAMEEILKEYFSESR
jgi:hypothetical protein